MVLYKMNCPVHIEKTLIVKKNELIRIPKKDGTGAIDVPLFYCNECNRYYHYSARKEYHLMKSSKAYKNIPIYYSNIKYVLGREGENVSLAQQMLKGLRRKGNNSGAGRTFVDSEPRVVKKSSATQSIPKNASNKTTKAVKLHIIDQKSIDPTVRIHVLGKLEIEGKLTANYNSIRKAYPGIATDQMDINSFIRKVFPSGIMQSVVVRNESFKNNSGFLIRSVEMFNKNSSYLNRFLPENCYLSFGGKVIRGEFVIQEIRIWENPLLNDEDIEADLIFAYDGPNHSNWLYSVTEKEIKKSENIEGELADWNAYLDWKRQLAELRIRGVKYIGFKINTEEREITFLAVTDGKDALDEFRKYLRRNEVSVFSNAYSNKRWYFEFNSESQDNVDNENGVALTFVRFGDSYEVDDIDVNEWDTLREYAKNYESDRDLPDTRFMIRGIGPNYFHPHCTELVFELSSNATELLDRQLRRDGMLSPDIDETLANEFYGDGYIATTQIGDFALIKRLKNAVNDLASGKSASRELERWLFDIKKARVPGHIVQIEDWQNKDMNDKQKEAVEKILSVPDVCLIQGPPGTGKTTVIAEAIYQLVIRNKRVLVASQANLAVDNALERLISNPKIRAIRLGSTKKIDTSVSSITESNVSESFYGSVVKYIDQHYLEKWEKEDEVRDECNIDYQAYQSGVTEGNIALGQIKEKKQKIDGIEAENNRGTDYVHLNELRMNKINLKMLQSFCAGINDDLDLMLPKEILIKLWIAVEPFIISARTKDVYLTKVGIDVSNLDTPRRIKLSNDILATILQSGKTVIKLYEKLNDSQKFGGSSKDLEELRVQEQILRNRVLSTDMDPSDIAKWKEISRRIAELEESGAGLSKSEQSLFDMDKLVHLSDNEIKAYLITTLSDVLSIVQSMLTRVKDEAEALVDDIDEEEFALEQKTEEREQLKITLDADIESLEEKIDDCKKKCQIILKKYNATHETLEKCINNYIDSKRASYKTSIVRDEWEDIFKGLKKWVESIPDYMQEKDIYLKEFINGCNVVGVSCTENARTLSENGFDDFDVVIIDEVSKATPPELLIPMLRGRKIVLVGDHRQLPPLFNEHEKTYQEVAEQQEGMQDVLVPLTMEDFNKYKDMVTASLFERYFENASDGIKETLRYQYRMHRDIMDIINTFYDDQLLDGNESNYSDDTKAHNLSIRSAAGTEMIVPGKHAYWFDSSEIRGVRIFEQRMQGSTSAENILEAVIIRDTLRKMDIQYANMKKHNRHVEVGIISFYYDQVALIRRLLRDEVFHAINIEVNTVDRFQGKEKEIVFVSLVRNVRRSAHNIDSHVAAFQRINVAFSRAQNLLIIVGAKDMYADQPVKMTDMNDGTEKVVMVYKNIIEMMDRKGTYFTSDEIIPEMRAAEILDYLERAYGGYEA